VARILRVAEADADIVVMGVRGETRPRLFGSTTHHVVRGARCPVLVVHTD
jgi:nucleotide-binding universal stress UspA family protein